MTEPSPASAHPWSLPEQHLKTLVGQGATRAYPKNTVIVSEGDSSDSMYVVLSGRVKVYLSDEAGKELLLREMGPGEYFGDVVLDDQPRSASVMTVEPSKFSVINVNQFRRFLADNPEAAFEILRSCMQRIRDLTRAVGNLGLMDVYGRVAQLLMDLSTEEGGKRVIKNRLTQQDIASRVGCSREMISRILKDLRAGGYITGEGDNMVIAKKPPKAW
ncbi:MAG: Crp/Fnr family transcriptional regulator [Burkholderiales bacterium]